MFNFILGIIIGVFSTALIFTIAILIGEAKRKPKNKKCKKCGKVKCECPPTEKYLKAEAKRLEKELKVHRLKNEIENIKN